VSLIDVFLHDSEHILFVVTTLQFSTRPVVSNKRSTGIKPAAFTAIGRQWMRLPIRGRAGLHRPDRRSS